MGASMLSVTGPAILVRDIDKAQKGRAFGINTTAMALGVTLGAPLGGIITGLSNWHWVFAVNVPIGLVALIVAARVLVDDSLSTGCRPRFDGAGIVASSLGLVLLLVGFNQGEELGGWTVAPVLGCFGGAAFLFGAFCWWELRCAAPLMDLRILRDRRLLLALLATLGGYMLYAGCNFLLPFLLIYLHGLRPEQVGMVLLAFSLAFVMPSPYVGRLSDRTDTALLGVLGMGSAAAASVYLVVILGMPGLYPVLAYVVWRGLAYALFVGPNYKFVLELGGAGSEGSISGLFKVTLNLSLVLGVCIFETIFSLPLPKGMGSLSSMLATGHLTREVLLTGFRYAYAFGAVTCLVSMGFLLPELLEGRGTGAGDGVPPRLA